MENIIEMMMSIGQVKSICANSPIFLNKSKEIWVVLDGKVDFFYAEYCSELGVGRRNYIMTLERGDIFFGFNGIEDKNLNGCTILAVGNMDTKVLGLENNRFYEICKNVKDISLSEVLSKMINNWIDKISVHLKNIVMPKDVRKMQSDEELEILPDTVLVSTNGVLWIRIIGGSMELVQDVLLEGENDENYFPLASCFWINTKTYVKLETKDTMGIMRQDSFSLHMDCFHEIIVEAYYYKFMDMLECEKEGFVMRRLSSRKFLRKSVETVLNILEMKEKEYEEVISKNSIFLAMRVIGSRDGFNVNCPDNINDNLLDVEIIGDIAGYSGVQYRGVTLRDGWWKNDNGHILAFRERDGRPVALIMDKPCKYILVDPEDDTSVKVDNVIAEGLKPRAFVFYKSFPNRELKIPDIIKFGFKNVSRRDSLTLIISGAIMGIFGLAMPVVTATVFNDAVPNNNTTLAVQLVFLLVSTTITSALVQLTRSVATLRMETILDSSMEHATWSRLMSLPATFFKQFSAGELSSRAYRITNIRKTIMGSLFSTFLTGIFSLFNLVLLFNYNKVLAFMGLGIIFVIMIIVFTFGVIQYKLTKNYVNHSNKFSGFVFQIFNSISKIRVAGAEMRAFYKWSVNFSKLRWLSYKEKHINNISEAFMSSATLISTLIIFFTFVRLGKNGLSIGNYMGFMSAYSNLLVAMLSVINTAIGILNIIPVYDSVKPILKAVPEDDGKKVDINQVAGKIELSHVKFRYDSVGSYILNDVSLTVEPGEFVAIVGASGSGKTTLLRIMLGFEKPESGRVYYDGVDSQKINMQRLRRKMGTVIQNGKLMAGNIYSNIIGANFHLNMEDAMDAAVLAGLEDDINKMPMGMNTLISEDAGMFSGGQKQRIMIARAIVNKPRILFFDEATSALDNEMQSMVMKNLEKLNATRVFIAHRLSTVMGCNKIIVMDAGEIVEVGTYEELINKNGFFANMAERQLA